MRLPRLRLSLMVTAVVTTALVATPVISAQPAPTERVPAWAPRLDSVARAALAAHRTPGATVAVVSDSRVVYTQGYGLANLETQQPMTADMLLRVGSVTKMVTGAMLAELSERNTLDMERPIGEYVPSLKGKRVGAVTTQQLMTHSAGWIDNAVAYGRMGEGALGEVMREVTDTLFFTEPGRSFSYSNPGVSMAGYVAEMAGTQRFATLVERLVLRPAGMTLSTFRPLEALTWPIAMGHTSREPNGPMRVVRPMTENTAQWAAGFLFSSAPELARFATMLMNGGQLDGQPVLSRGAVRRVVTGYVPHPGGSGLDSAMYGYGLVTGLATINGKQERLWTHGGAIDGYNATLTMLPDRKTAVVVLVNGPSGALDEIERFALEAAIGTRITPRVSLTPRPIESREAQRLVGRYTQGRNVFEILYVDNVLSLRQGMLTAPLTAGAPGELVASMPGGRRQTIYTRTDRDVIAYLYVGSRALARQP